MYIERKIENRLIYLSEHFPALVLTGARTIETEITGMRGSVGTGQGTVRVDGKLACRAEITFALSDPA